MMGIVGGWRKKVRLREEQEKGEMRVLAETCRTPRHAAKRPFFFFSLFPPPPARRNLYVRAASFVQCGASGARIDCPNREGTVYVLLHCRSETLCSRNLRVGTSNVLWFGA